VRCVVVSHKECWRRPDGTFATIGGFPLQIEALSTLFDKTTLLLPVFAGPPPPGARTLTGKEVTVSALPAPRGRDLRRKLALLFWLPANAGHFWRTVASADVVHALVPGDVGFLGILFARLEGKRLFVRHCGTWGHPATAAERVLHSLLERLASDCVPVFATGGGAEPPSASNGSVEWIFSTTPSAAEVNHARRARTWDRSRELRLASVGRLSTGKNVGAIISSIPALLADGFNVTLDIAGEGPEKGNLHALADSLHLAGRIRFRGNLDHRAVLAMLEHCDLFVFPTRVREGFPKALIEAMACGLPVVATRVSVVPELLKSGAGLLLEDGSPESISSAIRQAVDDPRTYAEMSARASEVAATFTLDRWRDQIKGRLNRAWGPLDGSATPAVGTKDAATRP